MEQNLLSEILSDPPRLKATTEARKVNKSCIECTRRKIRCDGLLPCNNCQWYIVQDRCAYRQRNRRTNPSWKVVEQLNQAIEVRDQLLSKILPIFDLASVPGDSRDEVLRLINHYQQAHPESAGPGQFAGNYSPDVSQTADDGEHEWDESSQPQDLDFRVADDVNGLAASQQPTSYLGSSSPSAVLRAIMKTCPSAKQSLLRSLAVKSNRIDPVPDQPIISEGQVRDAISDPPSSLPDRVAIDAYFDHAHYLLPMVDEVWFKREFEEQTRTDDAWIALSNMILAIGSIAAGDDHSHPIHYAKIQKVIGFNTFSSGNLEMLQALILLGGLYMHYINSPNTGYMVIGTAARMAVAMALHRDYDDRGAHLVRSATVESPSLMPRQLFSRIECRRRTWWCLQYCDAWGCLILGRPPVTRWDPLTMDTAMPSNIVIPVTRVAGSVQETLEIAEDFSGTGLRENVEISKLVCRIGQRMAHLSPVSAREAIAFEAQLQVWQKSRAQITPSSSGCQQRVKRARDFLGQRFQIARIVSSAQFLLRLAEDPSVAASYSKDEWQLLSNCREAASQLLNELCSNSSHARFFVWYGNFHLFQACMILLLFICVERRLPQASQLGESAIRGICDQIERATGTFQDLKPWTRTTDRYGEVIQALYSAILQALSQEDQAGLGSIEFLQVQNLSGGSNSIPMEIDQNVLEMFDVFEDWLDYDTEIASFSTHFT